MAAKQDVRGTGEPRPLPGAGQGAPGLETVLVVEDDQALRVLARLALEVYGYTVLAAANGNQALEIARHHLGTIEVLITDIQMPGILGPDLAARIASLRPGIKILFMSGYLGGAMADHDDLAPEAAFLEKPFSIEAFARKVRQLLDS
jgi:two-component system cell cycle sensor histidine kinase/response regulator CckA